MYVDSYYVVVFELNTENPNDLKKNQQTSKVNTLPPPTPPPKHTQGEKEILNFD